MQADIPIKWIQSKDDPKVEYFVAGTCTFKIKADCHKDNACTDRLIELVIDKGCITAVVRGNEHGEQELPQSKTASRKPPQ